MQRHFPQVEAEKSRYPRGDQSPEDENKCIEYFRESEVIELVQTAIQKDADKRSPAKHCLTTFWVKLVESNKMPKSKMLADPQELYRFLATPGIDLTRMFSGDEILWLKWNYVE